MSERFDTLFSGMSEENALNLIITDPSQLDNPGVKYLAASRLGACTSQQSLDRLIEVASKESDNLYDRITRRKALEALGRRKQKTAIPALIEALLDEDEPTVVNAVDSIARIGATLTTTQQQKLLVALKGPDNQKRAVIQALTRLNLPDSKDVVAKLRDDLNPLVAGAAHAHALRLANREESLGPLLKQLQDDNPGRRRAAVIDLGDAQNVAALEALTRCPVSMPLRAKSAFLIAKAQNEGNCDICSTAKTNALLETLLRDDPRTLSIAPISQVSPEAQAICAGLQHRDEARQYAAAKALCELPAPKRLALIDDLEENQGSDYGVHYLLANCVGLLDLKERSDLVKRALQETGPQYSKSRIAAAWSCLRLRLDDQKPLLKELGAGHPWEPLRWTCTRVLEKMD
jgi:HEAT repeat protein